MDEETLVDENFPLFSKRKPTPKPSKSSTTTAQNPNPEQRLTRTTNPTSPSSTFADVGLAEWAVQTCKELGMRRPTPVQHHCIPRILAGDDVLGLAQTGSGKTAATLWGFRAGGDAHAELAYQLAEQFRALGSCLHLRCAVVVGGMDMINQAQTLMQRPHVVIATPGRVKVLLEQNPDIPAVFARTKFLVLDEADRVLDVGFEEELRVTLLFSATMTSDLQTLLELCQIGHTSMRHMKASRQLNLLNSSIFCPQNVKDVYLLHILSKMEEMGIRSAIIFVSTCRSCHLLSLLLEELDLEVAALHSFKSQSLRLAAVHRFKSGQVPILLATDVASRGLDIPTVDLVVNYDIPRYPRDYVHRVGRTARAGRGGLSLSIVTQNDVDLIHEIEAVLGKQLDKFDCKEKEVLDNITKVYKARRVATMKMMDDGFEEKAKARKAQKLKTLAEKGLLKKKTRKRKREKASKIGD
ncbi:hypothetical protein AAG906_006949 [Vitis piasezkii]